MKTALCDRLGIELPIIQAPMGGAVGPALASAVSNAGGTRHVGALAGGHPHRAAANSRNPRPDLEAVRRQPGLGFSTGRALGGLSRRGCSRSSPSSGATRLRFVPRAKASGAIVLHTVGSVADAKQAVKCGVDIVVAQGWEAGGHIRGTVATMPLVPAVVDAVSPVPVVAAGGIADGRGLAAALALGAAGVWIGTRFLASHEATIHARYRERLLQASENDTVFLENLFDIRWPNAPHRTLRNQTVDAWEEAGRPSTGKRPGEGEVIATSRTSARSFAIKPTRPVVMPKVTLMRCRYGPDRASASCRRSSRLATSCAKLQTKPEQFFGGWL